MLGNYQKYENKFGNVRNFVTLLLETITNVGKTKQGGYPINVKLVDKNGNEIITIAAIIGELEPGESMQLSTNVVENCANAYDFIISKR